MTIHEAIEQREPDFASRTVLRRLAESHARLLEVAVQVSEEGIEDKSDMWKKLDDAITKARELTP